MGKKGGWLSSIKKALSPHSKDKKNQKLKKKVLGDERPSVSVSKPAGGSHDSRPPEEVKPVKVANEQRTHASTVAAEATATTSQAAVESTQLTKLTRFSGKSPEEIAAIRIQAAYRGFLARRALRALRGLVRLKTLIEGPTGNRQTATTLKSMQNLSRVQCQINSRRIRMSEENQALQRQLLQKQAKELETTEMGEEWNDSQQSKEQIEAKLLSKYEATMRRERAMAYSFSHQQPWKKSARTTNLLFMDPSNPQWGWSWLERYMAGRPLETQGEKNQPSVKNGINITGIEIAKSHARRQFNSFSPRSATGRLAASQKFRRRSNSRTLGPTPDDDSTSVFSAQSEMKRRHSIAGSSVRDDESIDSSLSVPSYMAQTKSAKAKSKGHSMLGPVENGPAEMEFGPKRLSFPGPPTRPRRHSGPPKVQGNISMVV